MPGIERSAKQRFHYVDFAVEGTRFLKGSKVVGWRITTADDGHLQREYWLCEGDLFLIDVQSAKPWSHATPFIVGKKAARINPKERQAIARAMTHWNPPAAESTAPGRKIKIIAEGPYVGVGVRRSGR